MLKNIISSKVTIVFLSVFIGWWLIVILSGYGINLLDVEWDFERMGQFGDSFGFLNSVVSIVAAFLTYLVFKHTIDENKRLREEVEKRDLEEEKKKISERFFALLDMRWRVLERLWFDKHHAIKPTVGGEIMVQPLGEIATGNIALEYVSDDLINGSLYRNYEPEDYSEILNFYRDSIGHYFRFTYHIVKFIDENVDNKREAYEYLRILRAQWSEAEQVLIAVNCAFGRGRGKFASLLKKYALLHNISDDAKHILHLEGAFGETAFNFSE